MRRISFLGLAPKLYGDHAATHADVAQNVRLYGGAIRPIDGAAATAYAVLDPSGADITATTIRTLHRSDGVFIGWPNHVTIVPDVQQRCGPNSFIYADQGSLWRTSGARVLCRLPPYKVGICAPEKKPDALVVVGAGCRMNLAPSLCVDPADPSCETKDGSGWVDAEVPEARAYVFTYKTEDEQESAPSPISAIVDVRNGDAVIVSVTDTPPAHAKFRLWYRSIAGTQGADFVFAGQTPVGTTTFFDDKCPLDLGDVLTTWSHLPPPCVEGVALTGDLVTVVWGGRDLWLSEPKLPHAYLPRYRKTVRFDIVTAMESQGSASEGGTHYHLVVLTKGLHYIGVGGLPEKFSLRELAYEHPATSARSVCQANGGLVFFSPSGPTVVKENSVDLLLEEITTRFDWASVVPDDSALVYHAGELLSFAPSGGMMLPYQPYANEQKPALTTHTIGATAIWAAPDDMLYIHNAGTVYAWGQGQKMLGVWRTNVQLQSGLWHPSAFKVVNNTPRRPSGWQEIEWQFNAWTRCHAGIDPVEFFADNPTMRPHMAWLLESPVWFSLWREERQWFRREVRDSNPHRTPRHNRSLRWAMQIETQRDVYELHVQTSQDDLTQEGGHA